MRVHFCFVNHITVNSKRFRFLLKLSKKTPIFFIFHYYFSKISFEFLSGFKIFIFFTNISQISPILFSSVFFQASSCFSNCWLNLLFKLFYDSLSQSFKLSSTFLSHCLHSSLDFPSSFFLIHQKFLHNFS